MRTLTKRIKRWWDGDWWRLPMPRRRFDLDKITIRIRVVNHASDALREAFCGATIIIDDLVDEMMIPRILETEAADGFLAV